MTQETKRYFFLVFCPRDKLTRIEDYEGMCWECWDDQLTEESDSMFGDLM